MYRACHLDLKKLKLSLGSIRVIARREGDCRRARFKIVQFAVTEPIVADEEPNVELEVSDGSFRGLIFRKRPQCKPARFRRHIRR